MDDGGFKDRVDKVFGSISSSSSSSSSWSLSLSSDAQLQRRQWKKPHERDDDRIPVSSSFLQNHDDWDIRSSIGLDSTLDNEEEEDCYDKMAEARENESEHRLYMKDVNEHGLYLNSYNLHSTSILVDVPKPISAASLKSILKKRKTYDDDASTPTAKRVTFHSTCKNADAQVYTPTPQPSPNAPTVPDYILNPSNYTRYTFHDSCHLEESSKHDTVEHKSCAELPKSLLFIPRKKRASYAQEQLNKQSSAQPCSTIAIAAQQAEISDDDDDVSAKAMSQKPVRQYRSKMEEYDDDDDAS